MDKKQKILSFQPIVGKEGSTTQTLAAWVFDQEKCRKLLARMITIDELPFKYVECEGFHDFFNDMQPRFEVPSRYTLSKDCCNLFLICMRS